jgi:hypothetical protein
MLLGASVVALLVGDWLAVTQCQTNWRQRWITDRYHLASFVTDHGRNAF